MRPRPTVLITGFGPFPGVPRNASAALASALAEIAPDRFPGCTFRSATLPTAWRTAPDLLDDLISAYSPVLLLHLGVARRTRGFVVETRARNVRAACPDVLGEHAPDRCIAAEGTSELPATLPCSLIYERLRRRGLPVILSRNAGTYLCNTILYRSLTHARAARASNRIVRSGFVHVPADLPLPDGLRSGPCRSRLSWPTAVAGGLEILAACLGDPLLPVRERIGSRFSTGRWRARTPGPNAPRRHPVHPNSSAPRS